MKKIILSLALVSCGPLVTEEQVRSGKQQHIDSDLIEHVNSYLSDASQAGLNVESINKVSSIAFVDSLPAEVQGRCKRSFMSNNTVENTIELHPRLLKGDKILLKVAIYHELSHCMFHAKHTTNVIGGLLSEYMVSKSSHYSRNWSALVTALFAEIKKQQPGFIVKSENGSQHISNSSVIADLE